jgi:conjugal transfer pilus assembly protein TraB
MKLNLEKFDKKKLFKSKLFKTAGVITALAIVLVVIFGKSSNKPKPNIEPVKIKLAREAVSTDELWRQTMQEKMLEQENILNKEIDTIKKDSDFEKQDRDKKLEELKNMIVGLQKEIEDSKQIKSSVDETKQALKSRSIHQYLLNLENDKNSKGYKPIKTADNYIPAGSFAKAVLLSGVDVSTSLSSSSDPDPILIRITDHGTLPRRFKSDLKDCHIIGAAYGDLSSERAKIRLEKLSCTEISTGEIIETVVAGFVAGEDGRQGMRGTVVSTEGRLLGNSFLSGLLGGLANNFNPTTASQGVSLFGSTKKQDTKERLQTSLTEGATSSLDRLSKYYIDRAENLQPIVQIGAGRKVDIIFTEGVFFGTSEIKKEIAKKRDENIRKTTEESANLVQKIE